MSKLESAVLEHLDAAYNLALWLMRHEQDAQDAVQESCMKAVRAYESYRGGDFRAWFLAIVRNTCFTCLRKSSHDPEQSLEDAGEIAAEGEVYDPQTIAERAADAQRLREAIAELPIVLREAIVLREMEGMSYREIGKISAVPIGTVMSRLARGRMQLGAILGREGSKR